MFEDRFVSFEGAFNVRDLGGVPAAGDATVRSGRVFRADSPNMLTAADKALVAELDVGCVIDLRSGSEAEEGTWAVAPGMERHLFEVIDPAKNPNSSPDTALPTLQDHEAFAQRYMKRLDEGADVFVEAARTLLANIDDGVIFHCSAGKDRTGLLAAFVLSAIGVDREIVVADYGASDEPMDRKFAFHLANPETLMFDISKVPPMMLRAPAPVMARLLELADDKWGGIVARFQEMGFTDAELAGLRTKLLV